MLELTQHSTGLPAHVLKAVKQFDAVNPDHSLPNVLVFVNHDDNSGYPDMCETLTGQFRTDSGEVYETMAHISEGVLGDKRKRIDLYIWIDDYRGRRRITGLLMTDAVPEHTAALRMLLINILPTKTAVRP